MPPTRHFLGHDTPLLPRAAAWLWRRMKEEPGRWIVAVPTARAGRRLKELLVQEAGGALADPPRIVGVAQVLAACLPATHPEPTPEERRAALMAALMELPTASRAALSRQAAENPSVAASWQVAGRLQKTLQTLWAGGVRAAQVAEASDRHGALAALESAYAKRLPSDPDLRLLAQLEAEGAAPENLRLVLVGCLDLHGAVAKGLRQWVAAGLELHVLSPAETGDADAFDDLGQVNAAAWTARALDLAPGELACVEGVADTHAAVLRLLERAGPLAPEDATIVLCDETEGPHLSAKCRPFGFKTRLAAGEPLATREAGALALAVLGLWRERHHESLRRLAAVWPGLDLKTEEALLDEARDHVLGDLDALPAAARATAQCLAQAGGLPASRDRAPLAAWVRRLTGLLAAAFPGSHLPTSPEGQALQTLGGRLGALASDALAAALPKMSAEEAAVILADDLAAVRLPDLAPPEGQGELIGLLDALLDEAQVMAVCGASEGLLPDYRAGDPFLPGHLRKQLGLPTEESLRARDKAILALALKPRRAKAVVVARHGAEGDPLPPAQLLFEGLTDAERVARSLLLFGDAKDQAHSGLPRVAPLPEPVAPRDADAFLPVLPPHLADDAWRARMNERGVSVTSLKAMLACPARFALLHALHWNSAEAPPLELPGSGFGDLLHEVLRQFHEKSIAEPGWRPRQDALADFLEAQLDAEATRQLGPAPGLAVLLQLERAKTRLQAFAAQQVALWQEGWAIAHAEHRLESLLDLPEGSILLHGRVDRVDRRGNALRIVDFKTGDDGLAPRRVHLSKQGWTDLQLPLYESLAWRTGLAQAGDTVETGYFLLDPSAKGWTPADFTADEVSNAVTTADDLLTRILKQEFPVGEVPDFDDGLGALLCDGAVDREARITKAKHEGGTPSVQKEGRA